MAKKEQMIIDIETMPEGVRFMPYIPNEPSQVFTTHYKHVDNLKTVDEFIDDWEKGFRIQWMFEFPTINRVYPQSIAFDLVPVRPMDSPSGILQLYGRSYRRKTNMENNEEQGLQGKIERPKEQET